MQQLISFLMIVTYTIYFCIFVKQTKQNVSEASGKCISMSLGMVSSTMIGLILALILPGDLAYSTVLSIVISCILAYFIGNMFGISAILEAMAASFMGAMMGAMLGEMIPFNRQLFMILAFDGMYLVTVTTLLLMIYKEVEKESRIKVNKIVPLFLSFLLFVSLISLVAILEAGTKDINKKVETGVEHVH